MNSMYDIQQLLKQYGIIIYTGDRNGDLKLMEIEINELYEANLLDLKDYSQLKLILRKEMHSSKK